MSIQQPASAQSRAYSGKAIIALLLAFASLAVLMISTILAFLVSVAAIAASLLARRELKASPDLRGFGLSLTGFLVGAVVLLFAGWPMVISLVVAATSWL